MWEVIPFQYCNQREGRREFRYKEVYNITGRKLRQFLFVSFGKEWEESIAGRGGVGWVKDLK